MLVCGIYIMWKVPSVVGSIMVVGVLTCSALLHSKCDLKTADECSLIWELMLYKIEIGPLHRESTCPVGWGCRIHPLPNECPIMTLNNLMVRFQ